MVSAVYQVPFAQSSAPMQPCRLRPIRAPAGGGPGWWMPREEGRPAGGEAAPGGAGGRRGRSTRDPGVGGWWWCGEYAAGRGAAGLTLEGDLERIEGERHGALRDLDARSATVTTLRAELDRLRRFPTPPPRGDAIPPTVDEPAPVAENRAARRRAERARRRG